MFVGILTIEPTVYEKGDREGKKTRVAQSRNKKKKRKRGAWREESTGKNKSHDLRQ